MQLLGKAQPLEVNRLQSLKNAFGIARHSKIVERYHVGQHGGNGQPEGSQHAGNAFAQLMPHKSQKEEHAKRE